MNEYLTPQGTPQEPEPGVSNLIHEPLKLEVPSTTIDPLHRGGEQTAHMGPQEPRPEDEKRQESLGSKVARLLTGATRGRIIFGDDLFYEYTGVPAENVGTGPSIYIGPGAGRTPDAR